MPESGSAPGKVRLPRTLVSAVALGFAIAHPQIASALGEEKHPLESMGPRPLASPTAISTLSLSSPIRRAASPVGVIYMDFGTSDGINGDCIGTLISSRLVLTARHCMLITDPATGEVEDVKPKAIYLLLDKLEPYTGTRVDLELAPADVGKDENSDWVLLRTKIAVSGADRRFPPVGGDPPISSDLYMIHRPFGDTLTVSGRECQTTDKKYSGGLFEHLCDSVPGSSGAPIFNLSFELVGIHRAGGKGNGEGANQGVLLSSIIAQSSLAKEALHQYGNNLALAPENPRVLAGKEISLTDGTVLSELNGGWSLLSKVDKGGGSQPLKIQTGSADEYVLWNPNTDFMYRVPKGAGNVKVKKGGDTVWTDISKGDAS